MRTEIPTATSAKLLVLDRPGRPPPHVSVLGNNGVGHGRLGDGNSFRSRFNDLSSVSRGDRLDFWLLDSFDSGILSLNMSARFDILLDANDSRW